MGLFNHEARCKKCKEEVIYTWRKCPYCGKRRFVRMDTDYFWETPIIPSAIISFIIAILFIISYITAKNNVPYYIDMSGLIVEAIFLSFFIYGISVIIFYGLILFVPFYIIHPILHYFGKKVTFIDIAKSCKNKILRERAIKHIEDQSVLVYVAKNDNEIDVRIAAVKKLTDQSELYDFAKNDIEVMLLTRYWRFIDDMGRTKMV